MQRKYGTRGAAPDDPGEEIFPKTLKQLSLGLVQVGRSRATVPLRHRQHSGCRAQKEPSGVELTDMLHQCSWSAGAQHCGLLQKLRRGSTLRFVFAGVGVET